DTVKARDNLGTMEAMKMEQPIPCPKDGVVKDVLVSVGDKVKSGTVLFTIE
ncbi:biotin-dependent enzyme, partial [Flavonifractor plautii DSM 6740]